MAATAIKSYSPQSTSGSFAYSFLAHAVVYGGLALLLNTTWGHKEVQNEYVDLDMQSFDAPPAPKTVEAPKPVVVDDSPRELQDEKSDIVGTKEFKDEPEVATTTNPSAEPTPYYKIRPKYPRAAEIAGISGWVGFEIDVNEKGEVENIRMIDGENPNTFYSEARRALEKWKYKPFVDSEGKPFLRKDLRVRVVFNLQEIESSG
jgi:TonB family protein